MPAGKSFGKALVFDVSNPAYPSLVAKYVAPLGQRGLGNADVGFATFIDMDDQRIAFATDFVATQVREDLVHFCALANARIHAGLLQHRTRLDHALRQREHLSPARGSLAVRLF